MTNGVYFSTLDVIRGHIKQSRYDLARNLLEKEDINNNYSLLMTYGLLENSENNYDKSIEYFSECMNDCSIQKQALLSLGKTYVQLGEFDIARKIFETVRLDEHLFLQAMFELIYLNILKGDFYKAKELLDELYLYPLNSSFRKYYRKASLLIRYYLGELKNDANFSSYLQERLVNPDEEIIIEHLKKHCNQEDRYTYGCFFPDIDLEQLLDIAKNKIKNLNANYYSSSCYYRFSLDREIGFKGDKVTNDICVVTILGTKEILSIYPVSLSKKFNQEGYQESEKLNLKRLKGRFC